MSSFDVVVVGGGLSGMRAADVLTAAGARVVVLEARRRVGGRLLSFPPGGHNKGDSKGERFDAGGQWVGPTQPKVLALAESLGIATTPQFITGKSLILLDGRPPIVFTGNIPSLPIRDLISLQLALWRIDSRASSVPVDAPWDAPNAAGIDSISVAEFAAKTIGSDVAREIFLAAVRAVFSEKPRNISLLFFLSYVRSAGGIEMLTDSKGGAQDRRFVNGAQSLVEKLADRVSSSDGGSEVQLGAEVTHVELTRDDAGGVRVRWKDTSSSSSSSARGGGSIDARHVIVACSPEMRGKIEFSPPPSPVEAQMTAPGGLFRGVSLKCCCEYRRAFWREAGYNGNVLCDTKKGIVQLVVDVTTASGAHPALVCFVQDDDAREICQTIMSKADDRRSTVINFIVECFGDEGSEDNLVAFHEQRWPEEKYTAGCVNGTRPGTLTAVLSHQQQAAFADTAGVVRIHAAGTECAFSWKGYMEGALEGGETAAANVVTQCRGAETLFGDRALAERLAAVDPARIWAVMQGRELAAASPPHHRQLPIVLKGRLVALADACGSPWLSSIAIAIIAVVAAVVCCARASW